MDVNNCPPQTYLASHESQLSLTVAWFIKAKNSVCCTKGRSNVVFANTDRVNPPLVPCRSTGSAYRSSKSVMIKRGVSRNQDSFLGQRLGCR